MSQGQPVVLPLIATPENRGTSTASDAQLINGYVEKTAMGDLWCFKRPGYTLSSTFGTAAKYAGGLHSWTGSVFAIWGDEFYKNGVSAGTIDGLESDGYTFSSTLGATPQLFFHNRASAYTYTNGGGLVAVADVDYPTETVPGSVYLDGTTYVMTPDCYIYGSGINDATSWDPLNVIRAQIEPSDGVAIAKQLSYLIAFKQYTTEVFYDAQNAAGSPLGRVEGAQFNYGLYASGSLTEIDGTLYYIGHALSGTINVMKLENLKPEIISTPAVERLLQGYFGAVGVRGLSLYAAGHKFYILSAVLGTGFTLVYDIGEKIWYRWTSPTGGYFPIADTTKNGSAALVGQGLLDGSLYTISGETATDNGTAFAWELITPSWDGGSRLRKMANLLEVVTDEKVAGTLEFRVSDDDYDTWSNFLSVNLNQERPMVGPLGTFRKRAFHFRQRSGTKLRVKAFHLHVDQGTL